MPRTHELKTWTTFFEAIVTALAELVALRSQVTQLTEELAAATAENEQLARRVQDALVGSFGIRKIEVVNGSILISFEDAAEVMTNYARAAMFLLDWHGAPNYLEQSMTVTAWPGEVVTLTMQRHLGKTPTQMLTEVRAELASARADTARAQAKLDLIKARSSTFEFFREEFEAIDAARSQPRSDPA